MTVWLFIGVSVLLVSFWMRSARRKRLAWLRALNLLGKWELDGQPADKSQQILRRTLTLSGELDGGTYVARDGDSIQRGDWRLRGHVLGLAAHGGGTPNPPRLCTTICASSTKARSVSTDRAASARCMSNGRAM